MSESQVLAGLVLFRAVGVGGVSSRPLSLAYRWPFSPCVSSHPSARSLQGSSYMWLDCQGCIPSISRFQPARFGQWLSELGDCMRQVNAV